MSARHQVFGEVDPHALLLEVPGVVALIDDAGVVRWINDQVFELSGHRPEDLIGTGMLEHVDVEANPLALESIGYALENDGIRLPTILGFRTAWGTTVMVEVVANNRFAHPEIEGLVVHMRPCAERDLIDGILTAMASGADMPTVFERVHLVGSGETMRSELSVILLSADGRFVIDRFSSSDAIDRLAALDDQGSPWRQAALTGAPAIAATGGDLVGPVAALAKRQGFDGVWAYPVTKLGAVEIAAVLLFGRREPGPPEPNAVMLAGQLSRYTQLVLDRHDQAEQLRHAAHHDDLTGLVNRNRFYDEVEQALHDSAGPVGLAYLDLDRFKAVNDRFGHRIGDRVLTETAARLIHTAGGGATVGRLGGDEFGICFPGLDLAALECMATNLLRAFDLPIVVEGIEHHVGATIGLSVGAQPHGASADELVDEADGALVVAKATEKGRWRVASATTSRWWTADEPFEL